MTFRDPRPTYVYVVEAMCGLVKIGHSIDPASRVTTICQHSASPVRLIAMWPGTLADETDLHRLHANLRSHNEWFRLEHGLAAFVDRVRGIGVDRVPDWPEVMVLPTLERRERKSARIKAAAKKRAESRIIRALVQEHTS
ncbi:GIY-YIG nuclease family protein [Rhodovulum sp. PH10]|uniref:GIY-YIG nuclease family protein n=1 Tax=Rhodovulum sp. PH10 TaxID=1187851 RepID=UPI00058FE391|nr:GIY-YIG nuclease family protein [Rhodovulum sp. PH10]